MVYFPREIIGEILKYNNRRKERYYQAKAFLTCHLKFPSKLPCDCYPDEIHCWIMLDYSKYYHEWIIVTPTNTNGQMCSLSPCHLEIEDQVCGKFQCLRQDEDFGDFVTNETVHSFQIY